MKDLALMVWAAIILMAFCGPIFFIITGILFVVLCILALLKPGWFGMD